MREASRLAGPPINRDPDINHVLDLSEQIVQIAIAHIEGHVAYEEGSGRRVLGALLAKGLTGRTGVVSGREGKLDGETAAFEILQIVEVDGALGGFDGFKCDIAKSSSNQVGIMLAIEV